MKSFEDYFSLFCSFGSRKWRKKKLELLKYCQLEMLKFVFPRYFGIGWSKILLEAANKFFKIENVRIEARKNFHHKIQWEERKAPFAYLIHFMHLITREYREQFSKCSSWVALVIVFRQASFNFHSSSQKPRKYSLKAKKRLHMNFPPFFLFPLPLLACR